MQDSKSEDGLLSEVEENMETVIIVLKAGWQNESSIKLSPMAHALQGSFINYIAVWKGKLHDSNDEGKM